MWRHLLTGLGARKGAGELFELEPNKEHPLRFQAMELLNLPRGVPDELWRAAEPEPLQDDSQTRLAL
jgi:hypothetical protein